MFVHRRTRGAALAALLSVFLLFVAFGAHAAAPPGAARIHYQRGSADYAGWVIYTWTGALNPSPSYPGNQGPSGNDGFGVYYDVPLASGATQLNFILTNGATKNCPSDMTLPLAQGTEIWQRQGDCNVYFAPPTGPYARIHYNRSAGDYGGWVIYTWTGALNPSPSYPGNTAPSGSDPFGVYYDVLLQANATLLNFILTNGGSKNCSSDMALDLSRATEIWQLQDDCTIYTAKPTIPVGNVALAKAHFLDRQTIAWPGAASGNTYQLYYAPNGGIATSSSGVSGGQPIALTVDPAGLSPALKSKFPYLAGALALKLPAAQVGSVPALLKGQLVVAQFGPNGLVDATALQIPGVLDDLFTFDGRLGAVVRNALAVPDRAALPPPPAGGRDQRLLFRVWAPTAQSVKLHVYDTATGPETASTAMTYDPTTGVWSAWGREAWINRSYYAYEVAVFVRSLGVVATNLVADPYALGAAPGNARSLVVDLRDPALMPPGWERHHDDLRPVAAPEDIAIYELHIRDFSASDMTVPAADRGKFRAFTYPHTDGMTHLKALADAGLTHVHLLPSFEIASLPDSGCTTPAIPAAAPDSQAQQAAVDATRDSDCFNWGYDPVLYTVPDGSYASTPVGTARIVEFRQMVKGLHDAGLRVVLDSVYNHTSASGQNTLSVLDKIVPGYYYRLDANGNVLTDSCCQDTAAEHAMMGKLLEDSALTWVRDYKVDGLRFDLMSFEPKALMVDLKARLQKINPSVYLYGEGWNFGAVGNDARFVQASQLNMGGTGIGTFSDRMRDAVRGGGPFDGGSSLVVNQGFINGLWYDPNALAAPATAAQRDQLNSYADWVRLGLAGTLKDYVFTDRNGNTVTGAQIDYFGQPAGYAVDPSDVVNYISAHDNYTLFDNDQFKMPTTASMADRVRVNGLGIAIVALSQGVPFFHAGDDLLRSKSMDTNSYNSGDWFNRLDFSYQSNNWGVGLPPAFSGNQGNWSIEGPLLANPALKPSPGDILQAHQVALDWLRIRAASPLLRLRSGADVKQKLAFQNVGPGQVPGLIVLTIDDRVGRPVDPRVRSLVAVINATTQPQSWSLAGYAGRRLTLHPVQARGADPVVKTSSYSAATGKVTVPPRTAAVFVEPN
ncbi:MAG: pullulanase-type alpha-1,6-glucosidase [Rubrivivax sp.]